VRGPVLAQVADDAGDIGLGGLDVSLSAGAKVSRGVTRAGYL
jgi:hypothetical protein